MRSPCRLSPGSQSIGTIAIWNPYTHKRLSIAISQIAREFGSYSYFCAPDLKEDSTPRTYEKILFGDVPYAPEQLTYSLKHRQEYRQDFQKAITFYLLGKD